MAWRNPQARDLKQILKDAGTPIADFPTQQRRQEEIVRAQAALEAPAVAPIPGQQVGVTPGPTGFMAYRNPPDKIMVELSDSSREFLGKLPDSPQYQDKAVRSYASQLWMIWRDVYRDELNTAVKALENLGEVEEEAPVEMADDDYLNRATNMLRSWARSERWPDALARTKGLFEKIVNRAAKVELARIKAEGDLDPEEREAWIEEHIADFAAKVANTTRTEIRDYIARELQEDEFLGEADPIESQTVLAKRVREHFGDFADWKADRLARTEVAQVYNAATLLAAKRAEIDRVQAVDAQKGPTDDECEKRDGKIFNVDEAWELRDHPNGTLAWRLVPANLSIAYDQIDGAEFNEETTTVTLGELEPEAERVILKQIVDRMTA